MRAGQPSAAEAARWETFLAIYGLNRAGRDPARHTALTLSIFMCEAYTLPSGQSDLALLVSCLGGQSQLISTKWFYHLAAIGCPGKLDPGLHSAKVLGQFLVRRSFPGDYVTWTKRGSPDTVGVDLSKNRLPHPVASAKTLTTRLPTAEQILAKRAATAEDYCLRMSPQILSSRGNSAMTEAVAWQCAGEDDTESDDDDDIIDEFMAEPLFSAAPVGGRADTTEELATLPLPAAIKRLGRPVSHCDKAYAPVHMASTEVQVSEIAGIYESALSCVDAKRRNYHRLGATQAVCLYLSTKHQTI
eukprot:TRINITY_DN102672_c0_g1_i1.p1 TRINITY_DN102672_c0_g1~~TRINITY_DN102672_c0_g1_i1.p1  ORF type:complete len:302 (-),score=44.64 TRINITY_DN102672_c0_g1_i1:1128-2033(-)